MDNKDALREFFSANGKKGGAKNKAKGSEYFKKIAAMRKTKGNFTNHPRRKKAIEE